MNEKKITKQYGAIAFLPLIIFLALYIGSGLYFTFTGAEDAFKQFPRHVALMIGIGIALLMNRTMKLDEKIEVFSKNAGNSGVMLIGLIYLLAGGFQGAARSMGGVDSVVNMGLSFIPPALLIPGVFAMSSFIATSIGTSMGTVAAMAPIAIGVAAKADLNVAIACAAVIGGAYFGDNLSIISDTTISATKGVGCEMKDKFKMNFFIALPAALITMGIYAFIGGSGQIEGDLSYSIIKIVPYIVVLITAMMGFNVVGVLIIGIIMSGAIGLATNSINFLGFIQAVGTGMEEMMSITILAILVSGLIGLVKHYDGIDWLIEKITSSIKDRKGAEYGIGLLAGLLSMSLVNNTIAIIISAPIAKEIGFKFNISPKRLASLLDIFACALLSICPHDGAMLITTGLAGISPIEVLQYAFYPILLILSTVITIQFGLLRTKEEKEYIKASKVS